MEINNIVQGFINSIFQNEKIEKQAEERLKICFTCPYKGDKKCTKCGCFLSKKARAPKSKCPDGRW